MRILLLLALVLVGCAEPPRYPIYQSDPTFNGYIELFNSAYKVQTRVPIIFGDIANKGLSGVCHNYYPNSRYNYIEIDRSYWSYSNYYGKHQLIFHELGHCVLGLKHNSNTIIMDGYVIPESIMYPYSFGDNWYYQNYLNYYVSSLIK